jgi:hypothetical protein
MRVALLANGPSLTEFWQEEKKDQYDLVIGCNTSAWLFTIDIWCVLDPAVVDLANPEHPEAKKNDRAHRTPLYKGEIPVPTRFATFPQFGSIPPGAERIDLPWYNRESKHLPKGLCREHGVNNCNFTFPNALYLASTYAQGNPVDVFGVDISTEMDVAQKWGDRSAERWKKELPWMAHAWQPNFNLYGRASEDIRNFLYGSTPFCDILTLLESFKGGQTRPQLKIVN